MLFLHSGVSVGCRQDRQKYFLRLYIARVGIVLDITRTSPAVTGRLLGNLSVVPILNEGRLYSKKHARI